MSRLILIWSGPTAPVVCLSVAMTIPVPARKSASHFRLDGRKGAARIPTWSRGKRLKIITKSEAGERCSDFSGANDGGGGVHRVRGVRIQNLEIRCAEIAKACAGGPATV